MQQRTISEGGPTRRLPALLPRYCMWRWQTTCLPKLWKTFNLQCGLSLQNEAVYQTVAVKIQGQKHCLPLHHCQLTFFLWSLKPFIYFCLLFIERRYCYLGLQYDGQ
jgi:hypothetical protein